MLDDWNYFHRRSDEELVKAGISRNPLVADVHRRLAKLYREKADRLVVIGLEVCRGDASGGDEDNFHRIPRSGLI